MTTLLRAARLDDINRLIIALRASLARRALS